MALATTVAYMHSWQKWGGGPPTFEGFLLLFLAPNQFRHSWQDDHHHRTLKAWLAV
jgi:hypothetical protein